MTPDPTEQAAAFVEEVTFIPRDNWSDIERHLREHAEEFWRSAYTQGKAAGLREAAELVKRDPDGYAVQSCCLTYGGSSFPGPMKDALKCHASIIAKALAQQADAGGEGHARR